MSTEIDVVVISIEIDLTATHLVSANRRTDARPVGQRPVVAVAAAVTGVDVKRVVQDQVAGDVQYTNPRSACFVAERDLCVDVSDEILELPVAAETLMTGQVITSRNIAIASRGNQINQRPP